LAFQWHLPLEWDASGALGDVPGSGAVLLGCALPPWRQFFPGRVGAPLSQKNFGCRVVLYSCRATMLMGFSQSQVISDFLRNDLFQIPKPKGCGK
jgi:hypothetical protein